MEAILGFLIVCFGIYVGCKRADKSEEARRNENRFWRELDD